MAEIFVPVSPGGTVIHWLHASSENEAWKKLLEDAAHMPYTGIAGFKSRGYRVEQMTEAELQSKSWFPPAMRKPLGD